jgi:hypothetical protein
LGSLRLDSVASPQKFIQTVGLALVVLSATAASVVAAPKDGYFDSAGVRIHYIEEGVGPAVVLVHGFAGEANNWVRSGVLPPLPNGTESLPLTVVVTA